jgi:adenylate cyclase
MLPSRIPETLQLIRDAVTKETGVSIDTDAAMRLALALLPMRRNSADPSVPHSCQQVSVLLADLRGFSAISEDMPAHRVPEMLNRYLVSMSRIAVRNGGTIDKFIGDAVMVLFGAPDAQPDDARRAVTCAVEMQVAMAEINRDLLAQGLPALYMGAGINTGVVMAGTLGSDLHAEYTVIGDEVNVTSRIEAYCLRGQVLISEATYANCADFVETAPPFEVQVKGRSRPVRLREVTAIPTLGLKLPRQEIRKSLRVEVHMPINYRLMINKVIVPTVHTGKVVDMSYYGMLAEVEPGLREHDEVMMTLGLSLADAGEVEICGRIRSIRPMDGKLMAGVEFSSVSPGGDERIRRFVQLLIQGSSIK